MGRTQDVKNIALPKIGLNGVDKIDDIAACINSIAESCYN